jgi:hypothetical protein
MKNQSENLMAAFAAYVAPSVELIEVSVERGFAESSVTDGGSDNDPVSSLDADITGW